MNNKKLKIALCFMLMAFTTVCTVLFANMLRLIFAIYYYFDRGSFYYTWDMFAESTSRGLFMGPFLGLIIWILIHVQK